MQDPALTGIKMRVQAKCPFPIPVHAHGHGVMWDHERSAQRTEVDSFLGISTPECQVFNGLEGHPGGTTGKKTFPSPINEFMEDFKRDFKNLVPPSPLLNCTVHVKPFDEGNSLATGPEARLLHNGDPTFSSAA